MFLDDHWLYEVTSMNDTVADMCYVLSLIARSNKTLVGEQGSQKMLERNGMVRDGGG